jgi:predicted nucleic acid-binding protein
VSGRGGHVILDTNIVLDLWVFDDPASAPLRASVESGDAPWLTTASMREELARVLDYPHIARRLQNRSLTADAVLNHFDHYASLQPDAPKAPYACKDPDDQKFIDLAVHHGAALHSKDAQVLCMKNRLARCGVALNPPAPRSPNDHCPDL